ncbi:short-chain dehydrogenase/reductase [Burkholderia sp. WAC0059]|uniref:SDR family NAD(P)-dependent oxidoreductase n=1 Tax=Burkholderia sp. WAC0059 TaxID=2066022 RepID=UPI000C7EE509|nr:SDR family NAD(P)-dependent oxidoreductase [Burkholderia sp. WAC0059]PLZ01946.1 short-chain dehydrogenase/reductase [Burkholderia sp. WAC0059]
MTAKTWLITGSSSGLGRAIAETVLSNGDNLVATARDTGKLADLQAAHRDRVMVAGLDVTDASAAKRAVQEAVNRYGSLDVLVNNAGFSLTAAFEQTSAAQFDSQIATNFFGVVNLMRAAIPVMRGQRAGCIINVSSAAGRMGMPSQAAYCAAKFAVGGLTEAVAQEVAGLGVKVVAVEPGSMRSNFGSVTLSEAPEPDTDYDSSAGAFLRTLRAINGKEVGDIHKVAKAIFELSRRQELPTHLILGSDAFTLIRHVDSQREALAAQWESVSRSVDADDADLSWLAGQ